MHSSPSRSRISTIRRNLLRWYDGQRRDLPWRRDSDPYRIWVSEIMLQQTRVEFAMQYFNRFVDVFPNVKTLAAGNLDDVLKQWEGLGYYSRARNLHAAAQLVCERFDGVIPGTVAELAQLPGIGPYTSGAIASMAFGRREPAVDGNVMRVLARLFELEIDTADASARRKIQPAAAELVDPGRPGDFNQSIMELGAIVCTPMYPDCPSCPLTRSCKAYKHESTDRYPVRVRRKPVPEVRQVSLVAEMPDGTFVIRRRPETGLLAGLWEFPTTDIDSDSVDDAGSCVKRLLRFTGASTRSRVTKLTTVRHAYSHFKVSVAVYHAAVRRQRPSESDAICFSDLPGLDGFALTGVTRKIVASFGAMLLDAFTSLEDRSSHHSNDGAENTKNHD